jgi:coenzyme PQQ precursor peptide PqqA
MPGKIRCTPYAEEHTMSWKTPKIVEIALGGEINCYACARVK